MNYDTLNEAIIARTAVLRVHAKRKFIFCMSLISIGVCLVTFTACFFITLSLMPAVVTLVVMVILAIILLIIASSAHDNYMSKYYRHALSEEYTLIPGTMTHLDTNRYSSDGNNYRWTGPGHNYGPLHDLNISGVGHPIESTETYKMTAMYVRLEDHSEVKIRINKKLMMEFRCNRPIYLIEWHNEKRGIIDKYDFYIPEIKGGHEKESHLGETL